MDELTNLTEYPKLLPSPCTTHSVSLSVIRLLIVIVIDFDVTIIHSLDHYGYVIIIKSITITISIIRFNHSIINNNHNEHLNVILIIINI